MLMINSWSVILETLESGYRKQMNCPVETSVFWSIGNYNVTSIASGLQLIQCWVLNIVWHPLAILKILRSLIFSNWQITQKIASNRSKSLLLVLWKSLKVGFIFVWVLLISYIVTESSSVSSKIVFCYVALKCSTICAVAKCCPHYTTALKSQAYHSNFTFFHPKPKNMPQARHSIKSKTWSVICLSLQLLER